MDSEFKNLDMRRSLTGRPINQVLGTLLQEWRKDAANKVLIFSKSVKLLDMLEFHLKRQSKY